jgi:hypothetical protein
MSLRDVTVYRSVGVSGNKTYRSDGLPVNIPMRNDIVNFLRYPDTPLRRYLSQITRVPSSQVCAF